MKEDRRKCHRTRRILFSAVLFWGILGNAVVLVKSFSSPARHIRRFDRQVRKHTSSSWDNQRRSNQNFRIATTTQLQSSAALSPVSWVYLSMLAFQFGCQPLLTKAFTPSKIVRSTVILAQDLVRFLVCCTVLLCSGTWTQSMQQWTLQSALHGAGIPSALYLVQNYCALMAYQNLPPVTFNVLNQTKTLSAAFFCYIVMGRPQSRLQIVSLLILLLSALVIEKVVPIPHLKGRQAQEIDKPEQQTPDLDKTDQRNQLTMGVLPVLIASGISGLAGALSQKNLQVMKVSSYVFSMELSAFSVLIMLMSLLLGSPDGKRLRKGGITEGWTWKTWIPIITNASGGVIVGLVTYHAGAVRKGFALIFGLILSGLLQNIFLSDEGISHEQVIGGVLASASLWMHSKFPPVGL